MFDKKKFAQILKNISETYNNQRDFSKKSEINRTYLSQYMNMKLEEPPKPKILKKLADASNGVTNYTELMLICNYLSDDFNELMGDSTTVYNNPYSVDMKYSQAQTFIFDIIYSYENLNKLGFKSKEMVKIKQIYKYLKEDALYENTFKEYEKIKKRYMFKNNNTSINNFYICPIYGKISAGQPNWAEECLDGYLPIDPNLMNIVNPEECFFLKINGESMNKVIKNGAYALIRKTDFVENGEIAVVLVNGFDATLKKFTKQGDVIVLEPMSDDPTITTQVYNKDTSIKVIGKYIGKMEMNS